MSEGLVGRFLFRELLRWAHRAEGIPYKLRLSDVRTVLPATAHALSQEAAQTPDAICGAVKRLTRIEFKRSLCLQGEEAELRLDKGFEALRLLNSEYTQLLHLLQQKRASHANHEGILCTVGQVIEHKKYKYRGVVCGWDRTCVRDALWASSHEVRPDQPFYDVLPDEDDCQRIFGATRISKYVAQDNIAILPSSRVLHRALDSYFKGYSSALGRYIPDELLQYVYPDEYQAADIEAVGNDSNILMTRELSSTGGLGAALERKQLLVDVG